MIKRISIGILVACGLNLQALDINLNNGWNLIGINSSSDYTMQSIIENNSNISTVTTNKNGSWISFDTSVPEELWSVAQGFTSLESGTGYWVKSNGTSTISIGDDGINTNEISFSLGWNLVSLKVSTVADLISELSARGITISSITTQVNGGWISFDTSVPEELWNVAQGFLETSAGQGYWVKVSEITDANGNVETPPANSNSSLSDDTLPPSVPSF
jgi:hypothetical protein